jgi:putative FmdB family regulatory protein
MPQYVFACHTEGCDLRFERALKMGEHPLHECPNCHEQAPRVLDGEGFSFAFKNSDAAPIGNTGVHKEDYPTADHVVGRDAEKRWSSYAEQKRVKDAARAQGGSHALIRHQGKDYIDYEPMSEVGRAARRKLVAKAVEASQKAKAAR